MMGRIARSLMQSVLKVVNLIMGAVGIAMILYGCWMIRVWQREIEASSFDFFNSTAPWFIYTFMGIGATLCLITCLGHLAADSANGFCLSCYMVVIFVLLLIETAVSADVLLNSDWEKDLPEDPTGRFHDFKEFVNSNFDICKWIGLLIILAQGFCILLAMVLRALGPNQGTNYDSEDECPTARLPLLNHHLQMPPFVVADPRFAPKNDTWNANK